MDELIEVLHTRFNLDGTIFTKDTIIFSTDEIGSVARNATIYYTTKANIPVTVRCKTLGMGRSQITVTLI